MGAQGVTGLMRGKNGSCGGEGGGGMTGEGERAVDGPANPAPPGAPRGSAAGGAGSRHTSPQGTPGGHVPRPPPVRLGLPLPRGSAAAPGQARGPSSPETADWPASPPGAGPSAAAHSAPPGRPLANPDVDGRGRGGLRERLLGARLTSGCCSGCGWKAHPDPPLPGSPPRACLPCGVARRPSGVRARRPRPASCSRRAAGLHKARRSHWLQGGAASGPGARGPIGALRCK